VRICYAAERPILEFAAMNGGILQPEVTNDSRVQGIPTEE
jgi:hypothetical protein